MNQNKNSSNQKVEVPVAVVMVPFPAQGHLNPLLHLSRLISAYKIPVHFVSTPTAIQQVKVRVHGWNPVAVANIHFHEVTMPDPEFNKGNEFGSAVVEYFKALMNIRDPVRCVAEQLSATRIVVIYDSMMPYVVQDIRFMDNAESYCFDVQSAFSACAFLNWRNEMAGKSSGERDIFLKQVPSLENCFPPEIEQVGKLIEATPKFHSGYIYNTSRVIEAPYLDLLMQEKKLPQWGLGPFNPVILPSSSSSGGDDGDDDHHNNKNHHECLDWLGTQKERSVVFVSFGTTSSLSHEQIVEIALGLERSGQKFIWVLREDDAIKSANDEDRESVRRRIPLPEGYEERVVHVRRQGYIVRDWAPQLEILAHPSTGAFITHCGSNSCMESISHGVAMGTWPMQFDHPANAVLVIKVLKVGVPVREWSRRDQVLPSTEVEEAVKKLMMSEEGEMVRKRAAEFGEALKKSLMEGGASRMEMDSFISHITRVD